MFDDLIVDKKKLRDRLTEVADAEVCPSCGSADTEFIYGEFKSRNLYVQIMVCLVCEERWSIFYDENLNIIDIKSGTEV